MHHSISPPPVPGPQRPVRTPVNDVITGLMVAAFWGLILIGAMMALGGVLAADGFPPGTEPAPNAGIIAALGVIVVALGLIGIGIERLIDQIRYQRQERMR